VSQFKFQEREWPAIVEGASKAEVAVNADRPTAKFAADRAPRVRNRRTWLPAAPTDAGSNLVVGRVCSLRALGPARPWDRIPRDPWH